MQEHHATTESSPGTKPEVTKTPDTKSQSEYFSRAFRNAVCFTPENHLRERLVCQPPPVACIVGGIGLSCQRRAHDVWGVCALLVIPVEKNALPVKASVT